MPPPEDANPPQKPFSLSLSSTSQLKKPSFNLKPSSRDPSTQNRALPRRPHHLHHDSDSDNDEETLPAAEAVTGFDTHTGAAIAADGTKISAEKEKLVIPVVSGNNWRERPGGNIRARGKNLLPKEVQAIREAEKRGETAGDNVEREGPSMAYGISFAQPSGDKKADGDEDREMKDADKELAPATEERKPRTEDEIALQALIRETNGELQGSDLIIESAKRDEGGDTGPRYDETTSFRADVEARPEPATLDQYNAIPVEEFGAALLRGMGWKDGQSIGRGNYGSTANPIRPRIPERRPGFLGIGAKDASGGKGAEMELGAWGKSAMRKGARNAEKEGGGSTEGVYMPVMMRNKQTGEYITEEELSALQKEAKARKVDKDDEWKERRDRNLEKSGRDRDRDRNRDRDYKRHDYDDDDRYERRKGSSRRDRDRSSSGDRHLRRDRRDNDNRYYRDRGRDRDSTRDRERERERDRDRDRERRHRYRDDDRYSSRHSSSRRDRDRDRDSDRDSHRRRRDDR